jgi:phosphoenolpyruvate-protein kinase (PTS system EI component)
VILARSLGIPIVTGIPGVLEKVKNGDLLIVDGSSGSLHIDPSSEIRDEYLQIRQEFRSTLETHPEILGQENRTHDGVAIKILANIAKISDLEMTTSSNMDGVGLFRSEFDYVVSKTLPTAHRLAETYGAAAERLKGRPLNVRLLEIDTSRPFHDLKVSPEPNPALGQRSLRLLLRHPRLLEPHLEALLLAAPRGNIGVLVPFVSSLDDLKTVTGELERIARKGGLDRSLVRIGMVLEIPSVLFQLQEIIPHVDFIAIGVDNLSQYLLAADRNNSLISEYQDRANPGVLRALAHVAKILEPSGREFYPYGDIVADPLFTPLLLGMGFRNLSMSPVAVPRVKGVLTRLDIASCTRLAAECLGFDTGARVQRALAHTRQQLLAKVPSV